MTASEKLQRVLQGVGASKIIYSLVMPETEAIKRRVFLGDLAEKLDRAAEQTDGKLCSGAAFPTAYNQNFSREA